MHLLLFTLCLAAPAQRVSHQGQPAQRAKAAQEALRPDSTKCLALGPNGSSAHRRNTCTSLDLPLLHTLCMP